MLQMGVTEMDREKIAFLMNTVTGWSCNGGQKFLVR
jgi:hypothetical protein